MRYGGKDKDQKKIIKLRDELIDKGFILDREKRVFIKGNIIVPIDMVFDLNINILEKL